jgi:vacuolar-type H+-ATPase subunit E/Vma4
MAGAEPAALCEEILAEGRRRAEAVRSEARASGAAALAQSEREAQALLREAEDGARAEAARKLERARAGVEIEIGRLRADRVEALLASLRERARRELLALGGPAARAAVCVLAAEALRRMTGAGFVLSVAPGAALGPDLAEEILRRADGGARTLSVKEDPALAEPGFLLRDAEGRQEWDGRLGARLDRLWPALRIPLARATGLLPPEERAP